MIGDAIARMLLKAANICLREIDMKEKNTNFEMIEEKLVKLCKYKGDPVRKYHEMHRLFTDGEPSKLIQNINIKEWISEVSYMLGDSLGNLVDPVEIFNTVLYKRDSCLCQKILWMNS